MTAVIRVLCNAPQGHLTVITFEATLTGTTWVWSTAQQSVDGIVRIEVFRANEDQPCLVLDCHAEESTAVLKDGTLSFALSVLTPCIFGSPIGPRRGTFKLQLALTQQIFAEPDPHDPLHPEPKWAHIVYPEAQTKSFSGNGQPFTLWDASKSSLPLTEVPWVRSLCPFASLVDAIDVAYNLSDIVVRIRWDAATGRARGIYVLEFSVSQPYELRFYLGDQLLHAPARVDGKPNARWSQTADNVIAYTVLLTIPNPAWQVWLSGFDGTSIVKPWNTWGFKPYSDSLQRVAAGEAASIVPSLQSVADAAFEVGLTAFFEKPEDGLPSLWRLARIEMFDNASSRNLELSFPNLRIVDPTADAEVLTCRGTTPSYEGEGDWADVDLGGRYRAAGDTATMVLRVDVGHWTVPATSTRRMRVGSLDLYFGAGGALKFEAQLTIAQCVVQRYKKGASPTPIWCGLDLHLSEAELADVQPGAEDPLPDSTRTAFGLRSSPDQSEERLRSLIRQQSGLIFRMPGDVPKGAATTAVARLEIEEASSVSTSRSMVMRLRKGKIGVRDVSRSIIYLGREPFLVACVRLPSSILSPAKGDEIANWSLSELEGQRWQLASAADGFDLGLPPQAIGEAMDKTAERLTVQDGTPVEFRFSAPARFRLRSAYFNQGYAESPWNLSRVLGYPGERAPGATVERLRFELVYGITTEIDAREVSQRLELAELNSRTGPPAALLERALLDDKGFASTDPRRSVFLSGRVDWAEILALYRSRLAVLELYDAGASPFLNPGLTPDAGRLVLSQGVTGYVRQYAQVRYPIDKARRGKTAAPPKMPLFLRQQIESQDQGIGGGYAWPYEQDSVFRSLWRDPVSDTASVAGLRFSALGGWGEQRLSFDNKRSTIITTTAMGRLTRISLERVGRIGVFWNRCKHVIVYERTTLAAAQFMQSQAGAASPTASRGRAILRKVAEYIEILEPERSYPESSAAPSTSGFVEATHFTSRRILVDSAWGSEGANGIEIPLWNPRERPSIYPRPSVCIITTGAAGGIAQRVPREIAEPDRLVFFSSTDPTLDDRTNLWPPVADVDYANLPPPAPGRESALDAGDPDAMLPDAIGDLPGWRRFTWPLTDADGATNLVSGRAQAVLSARLTHVSMMRAGAASNVSTPAGEALKTGDTLRNVVAQLMQNAMSVATSRADPAAARAAVIKHLDGAKDVLTGLGSALAATAKTLQDTKVASQATDDGDGSTRVRSVQAQLRTALRSQSSRASDFIAQWKDDAQKQIGELNSVDTTAVSDLALTLQGTVLAGLTPLRSGFEALSKVINDVSSALDNVLDDAFDEFDALISPITQTGFAPSQGMQTVQDLRVWLADTLTALAQAIPMEAPTLLQGVFHAARVTLGALNKSLDKVLADLDDEFDKSTDDWLKPAGARLQQLQDAIFGALDASPMAETLGAPQVILAKADEQLTSAISKFLEGSPNFKNLVEGLKSIDPSVEALSKAVTDLAKTLQEGVDGFVNSAENYLANQKSDFVGGALAWGADQLPDLTPTIDHFTDPLNKLRDSLLDKATSEIDDVAGDIARTLQPLAGDAESLFGAMRTGFDAIGLTPTFQTGQDIVRVVRAVGEGPVLPEMSFNRDRVAYFFDDAEAAVRTSPMAAMVNRVGDDLKAMGIRLPTQSLLDRVIPDSLENFSLSNVFPDFAALKNSALFDKLKLPQIANDQVHVTHDVDPVSRQAWLKATVDVPFDEPCEAFALGPLSLVLNRARLMANASMTASAGGAMQRTTDASIRADWQLVFGGASLVTFTDTTLRFDAGGHMQFSIRPENIQMDAALEWLSDVLSEADSDDGDGLTLELEEHNGLPVGVRCTLSMELPPLGAGAFALAGVSLGGGLSLGSDPDTGEFAIGINFNASRKTDPFTLTIAFLDGGGWVEAQARYLTASGEVVSVVTIGIVAGAGAAFSLGPCEGSVYVQFGIFVDFSAARGSSPRLSIGIMLLVRGSVVLYGLATISITLLLEAVYSHDGSLNGHGSLNVSVRISIFYTARFSSQVTYPLRGGGSGKSAALHRAQIVSSPSPRVVSALSAAGNHAAAFQ